MKQNRISRALRTGANLAVAGTLVVIGAIAMTTASPAAPANAAEPQPTCPPTGEAPPIGSVPTYTDANVAVYAGGDFVATGNAAESEGLLLVRGNATFDKANPGVFNVGGVGAGSGITPAGGETMLAVGGDLVVGPTTTLDVGATVTGGGAVKVGGTSSGTVATNGASTTTGLGQTAAMDPYADFQSVITDTSAEIAGFATTGGTVVAGSDVTFTGTPGADPQVFTIDADVLSTVTTVRFSAVPADVPIVVNVVGSTDVAFSPNHFELDGARVDDFASTEFGNTASRLLWNFADTTSLLIGGSSQFMGSILAPAADAEITASTNGRVHVGGDLTTRGDGNELHNYPWTGGGALGCDPFAEDAAGGFSAAKTVTGTESGDVPADTEFTLAYSYELGGETVTGELALRADGTVVDGPQDLPVGTIVDFEEIDLPVLEGVEWGTPTISPDRVTIADDANTLVTVTNVAETTAEATGGFSASKQVTGDAADLVPADTMFTLAYSYRLAGETIEGELLLPADGTVVDGPQDLPVGTVVEFEEVDLPEIDGVEWGSPELSASSITIGAATNAEIVVTNDAAATPAPSPAPGPAPGTQTDGDGGTGGSGGDAAGGSLAETGFDGVVPMIAATVALLIGAALFVAARRRKA